ncbi:hypothetical protein MAUB1S_00154 [Mycolicibacterium aubagnense]
MVWVGTAAIGEPPGCPRPRSQEGSNGSVSAMPVCVAGCREVLSHRIIRPHRGHPTQTNIAQLRKNPH